MFTLEESALLRRMFHILMWIALSLGVVLMVLVVRHWPWFTHLWLVVRGLARR